MKDASGPSDLRSEKPSNVATVPGVRTTWGAVPIPVIPKLNVPAEVATCNGTGRGPE